MSKHYLLIDANNVAFAAQSVATSNKTRTFAGEQETTAVSGMLTRLREYQVKFPDATLLLLWDEGKAWRYAIYPEYKGNRKNNPLMDEAKAAIKTQRKLVTDAADAAGIMSVHCMGLEADDLAYALSKTLGASNKVTLVTADQDWLQLVNGTVSWFNPQSHKHVRRINFELETGMKDVQRWLFAKCLQGDSGDNVKGVKGLGEVTAQLIANHYTDMDDLIARWPARLATTVAGDPFSRPKQLITKLVQDPEMQAIVPRNYELMDLSHPSVPKLAGTVRTPGKIDLDKLHAVLSPLNFSSILKRVDTWIAPFAKTPIANKEAA